MPEDDVSDLRDVVDAINRLCDTMKTSSYDEESDEIVPSQLEYNEISSCTESQYMDCSSDVSSTATQSVICSNEVSPSTVTQYVDYSHEISPHMVAQYGNYTNEVSSSIAEQYVDCSSEAVSRIEAQVDCSGENISIIPAVDRSQVSPSASAQYVDCSDEISSPTTLLYADCFSENRNTGTQYVDYSNKSQSTAAQYVDYSKEIPESGEIDVQYVEYRDIELVSPEEVVVQKAEVYSAERWSDSTSLVSLPGQVDDVETVTSDTEPVMAQCEISEMYYTASSEVSLLSDTELPEKAVEDEKEKDDRKSVIAGHVAAMRERFESMTRTNTPCPDLIRSLSPSLEVFRNISPSPDRLA